ncbi:MAG: DUF349 domain-containing protein [Bacteroidota bacterium]
MSQEQNFDLNSWWEAQAFAGKELYKIDDAGALTLTAHSNIKERVVANITAENADAVVKNLIEKFEAVEARVKEMEVEWLAAEDKLKLSDKVGHLKEYLGTVNALGDMQKPALLVHDWEHTIYKLTEEVYAEKLKLVELAEGLGQSDQWKETTQAFKDITDKWKASGHLDRNRNDKLWNRIEAARTAFYNRKREHHQEEEKDLLHNLDLKLDLVERAEALTHSQEWKKTTEIFHKLTEEWKTIGHTLSKKNEELWQRFIAAKSNFFERKREHSLRVQQEHAVNSAMKMALVDRAEALKDSMEWNVATQEYATLMEEWKKTGRVSHEKGEELWKRFTEARDHFFNAKRQHTEHIRGEQEENYAKKKALLDKADRIKNNTHWSDTTAEMNELLDEWKKIGNAGKAHSNKLWEDFLAARKHFFARKDASRDQRKQNFEVQKVARIDQARGFIMRLEMEIKEEEAKIADFKVDIENITPGKKAEELRQHLAKLIEDGAKNIKRLHEKLAASKDELADAEAKKARENKEGGDKPKKENQQKEGQPRQKQNSSRGEAAAAQQMAPAHAEENSAQQAEDNSAEPRAEQAAQGPDAEQVNSGNDQAEQGGHEPQQAGNVEPHAEQVNSELGQAGNNDEPAVQHAGNEPQQTGNGEPHAEQATHELVNAEAGNDHAAQETDNDRENAAAPVVEEPTTEPKEEPVKEPQDHPAQHTNSAE